MNVEWTDEMASLLEDERVALTWSRQKLAAEAGVSERTVVDLERNSRHGGTDGLRPRRATVQKVANALGSQQLADLTGVKIRIRTEPPGMYRQFQNTEKLTNDEVADLQGIIDSITRNR